MTRPFCDNKTIYWLSVRAHCTLTHMLFPAVVARNLKDVTCSKEFKPSMPCTAAAATSLKS